MKSPNLSFPFLKQYLIKFQFRTQLIYFHIKQSSNVKKCNQRTILASVPILQKAIDPQQKVPKSLKIITEAQQMKSD